MAVTTEVSFDSVVDDVFLDPPAREQAEVDPRNMVNTTDSPDGSIDGEDRATARHWALEVLGGSWRGSQDVALSRALAVLSRQAAHEGRIADGIRLAVTSLRRLDRAPHSETELQRTEVGLELARMLTATGDFSAADLAIGRCDANTNRYPYPIASRSISQALLLRARGRMGAASAAAEDAVAVAEGERRSSSRSRALVCVGEAIMSSVALAEGDLHQARTHVRRGRVTVAGSAPVDLTSSLEWSSMRLAEAEDGPDAALAAAGDTYDTIDNRLQLLVDEPDGAAWLVRVAIAAGDERRAARVASCGSRLSAAQPELPAVVAASNHAVGLLERDVDMIMEAAKQYRHPSAAASALEDAGAALAADGKCEAARATFDMALDGYARIGATRDQTRVTRRLAHIDRGGHRVRPMSGWGSLTPAERAVGDLVAEGLTNPEVAARMTISRHTVDFHLRQVFRKLGIRSRVELARAAALRGA